MNQIEALQRPEQREHFPGVDFPGVDDSRSGQAETLGTDYSRSPRAHVPSPSPEISVGESGSALHGGKLGGGGEGGGGENAAGPKRIGATAAGDVYWSSAGGTGHPLDLRGLLLRHRLIPSARISSVADAVPLAEALHRAGLPVLEIALSTDAALPAIEAIRTTLPGFSVGAGTVLSPGHIHAARSSGAQFGSGPAMYPGLLAAALSSEFPFLPGAMTPSEIEYGMQWGFSLQCFYPAAAAGGPAMVRALVEPYRHMRLVLIPTGGVRMADFQEYLVIPEVGAVAGRFLCEGALIEAGMWEDIEAQAVLCMGKAGAAVRARLDLATIRCLRWQIGLRKSTAELFAEKRSVRISAGTACALC
jgi:2-dehydro-3-deoxyphosphogluconate aldolase / (4S)-4-hydroxy-2-oxoglutarate aldolase